MEALAAEVAHNLKVVGSNPTPATKLFCKIRYIEPDLNSRVFACAILVNALSTFDESPHEKWGFLGLGTISSSVASATVETIARNRYVTKSYHGGANDR